MVPDGLIVFKRVFQLQRHLAIFHQRHAVTDGKRLFVVGAQVQEREPARGTPAHQRLKPAKVRRRKQVADVAHHHQPGAGDHGAQQLHHAALVRRQRGDLFVRRDGDLQFTDKLVQLATQHPRLDNIFFKPAAQHKNIVCHR
ncbi:hypothetical protein SDC9_200727 [bioreactor metagenome]|uniref:Uncharacterized protein n=1 Tax=bioreactor metagenome TaxID=1076179 RepID=A0A645IXF5_9ZZZZ